MCECKMAAFLPRNCGGQLCEHLEHGWRKEITAAFNTRAFLSSLARCETLVAVSQWKTFFPGLTFIQLSLRLVYGPLQTFPAPRSN